MLVIGSHLSVSRGFAGMAKDAVQIGANTFQFFTRNPQGGQAKEIDPEDVKKFLGMAEENGFQKFVAHAPYTLNACSDKKETREFARLVFADDLKRMENLPHNYYNFHPGSHVGQGVEKGIEMIAEILNEVLTIDQTTTVLLETMSGKGSEVGATFEELRAIIDRVELKDKIGVCLDTCHVYSAGYDIAGDLDGVLEKFDKIIGLKRLKAVHLNDSKTEFASHKDRHEQIGKGSIGAEAIIRFINHSRLKQLPFILETPNDLSGWADEIKFLKENFEN